MLILHRYLTARVLTRFLLVLAVLAPVFAGYTMTVFLSRAAAGFLKPSFVLSLMGMKTIIATEVIVPISLYVAVLFAVEHLRRTQETTAMQAIGFGPRQAAAALLPLFLLVSVVVGVLSVWVRPDTYAALYRTRALAEAAFDLLDVEAGRFYVGSEGDRVVMVERKEEDGEMRGVFIWNRGGGSELVIRAAAMSPRGKDEDGRAVVEARNLRVWEIDEGGCSPRASTGSLVTTVDFGGFVAPGYKVKAAPTRALANSDDPEDLAEFQWRITRPLSVLLLGLLALCIGGWSRLPGRQVGSILIGIVACVAYHLVSLTARSWVRDGAVGPVPGLWWVDAVLAVILLALFLRASRRRTGEVAP